MRTKIYQINSKRDVNRVKFEGLDLLERYQGSSAVDPSIYDEVFNAEIDETDLEAIYQRFNTVGHPLHRGHSLSVSDVVVNDNGAFSATASGFSPLHLTSLRLKSRTTSCVSSMSNRIRLPISPTSLIRLKRSRKRLVMA